MPRPEYKTITVKLASFTRFCKVKDESELENTEFLEELMDMYQARKKKPKEKKQK